MPTHRHTVATRDRVNNITAIGKRTLAVKLERRRVRDFLHTEHTGRSSSDYIDDSSSDMLDNDQHTHTHIWWERRRLLADILFCWTIYMYVKRVVCDTILCHCMCVWSERLASKTIYKLHIRASEIRITYSMMILTSVFGFSKCIILLFLEEVIVRGIIASRFICGES